MNSGRISFVAAMAETGGLLVLAVAGCQPTTPKSMSLEEAKQATPSFAQEDVGVPPRKATDILALIEGARRVAISGLGRAFLFAGARALLVSNWPVETTSNRVLTTDIFNRQAGDPTVSRAGALQHSMLGLIDGPGYLDTTGTAAFSYAHPIFWAPFTLTGDCS